LAVGAPSAIAFSDVSATQWFFSQFMLCPVADNWFFAGDRHWGYTERMGEWRNSSGAKHLLAESTRDRPGTIRRVAPAIAPARVGLSLGNWMAKVRR
jgi:hypothetical protein